jgi:glycosyltransferase involved in cell wall biosynthesis
MASERSSNNSLSIVVPAYNEESTIRAVAEKLLHVPHLHEVIIVDDCSQDRTQEIAQSMAAENPSVIKVIRHQKNGGKTEALKTGFAATTGNIVIVQDADLEYDPDEIEYVINPIVRGMADVVFGSRFQVRRAARVLYFYHYIANQGLTFLSDVLTNLNLTDVETGYKAFKGEIIRNMIITSSGFGFEIEVTAKIAKLKCAIYEVPISYYGRTYEEGKKIGAKDGIAALWYLIKYNLLTSLRASYKKMPEFEAAANLPGSGESHEV